MDYRMMFTAFRAMGLALIKDRALRVIGRVGRSSSKTDVIGIQGEQPRYTFHHQIFRGTLHTEPRLKKRPLGNSLAFG